MGKEVNPLPVSQKRTQNRVTTPKIKQSHVGLVSKQSSSQGGFKVPAHSIPPSGTVHLTKAELCVYHSEARTTGKEVIRKFLR